MAMVALNAARTKVVPKGSLEARWMVDEDDVEDDIRHAVTQPKMQALMEKAEERRLEEETASVERQLIESAYRAQIRQARIG